MHSHTFVQAAQERAPTQVLVSLHYANLEDTKKCSDSKYNKERPSSYTNERI